jgi:CrcB protein
VNRPDSHSELPSDPDAAAKSSRPLHLRPSSVAWVFAGGVVGTALRYYGETVLPHDGAAWPWATFLINLAGAFALAADAARAPRHGDRLRSGQRRRRTRHRVARHRRLRGRSQSAGTVVIVALTLLAGATGAVARFLLDSSVKRRWHTTFPWATVFINVTGSLLLGVLAGLVLFAGQPAVWQTVIGTGFCGGYTTFSTASFETVRLVQQNRPGLALLNALGSLVLSVAGCAAGLAAVWAL